jgi:hypothetical protein
MGCHVEGLITLDGVIVIGALIGTLGGMSVSGTDRRPT